MTNKHRSQKWLLSIILSFSLLLGGNISAQSGKGKLSGKVTDKSTNEILLGANVLVLELGTGASTDIEGFYYIDKLPAGTYKLIAQYVGFQKSEQEVVVSANRTTEVNFALVPTAVQMEELIVTGQGSAVERRKLSSTVETIDVEEIRYSPVESVEQLLQGRVAGLSSFTSSGMPGTGGRISTRGIKSTVSSSTPVVYVDNVRVDNGEAFRLALDSGGAESSALSDLVVGEIDRVEVIKGGAASTIYGSEAANGVIQIFTRKGTPGTPQWSIKSTQGYDAADTKFIKEDYVKDNVMQTGYYQAYNVGVSGGNQFFTYNVNSKIYRNTGIIKNDKNKMQSYNYSAGARIVLQEDMNLELSSSYTKNQFERIFNNNAYVSPFSGFEDGSRSDVNGYDDDSRNDLLETMMKPEIKDDVDRFRLTANFDHKPYEGITYKATFGIDYRKNEERQFVPKSAGDFFGVPNGYVNRSDREYMTITMALNGTYQMPTLFGFLDNNVTAGIQGFRIEDREEYAEGEGFNIPGTDDFDNAALIDAMESNRQLFNGGFYLVDQVGLYDKIFVDFGFRVDANSTFGDEIGMQFYPKLGVAYNISRESFYPELVKSVLPTLKLRSSWGATGKFPEPFTRDRTYTAKSFLGKTAMSFGNPGNDDIKPERTESWDIGFDAGFFKDRLFIEFNYYQQITKDALFSVPEDPTSGYDTQLKNIGEISNKGLELSLFSRILQYEDVSVSARLSYATVKNEITSLGGASAFSISSFTFLPRRVEEGQPVGVFRVNEPVLGADGNYTGDWEEKLVGNPLPKHFGSFNLSVILFKNLTLNSLLEYAIGHQFVNLKKTLRFLNNTEDSREVVPDGYNIASASSVWLEDADWVKLREVSIVYRMPELLFGGVTLSAAVRNVATFGVSADADPELNGYQPNGADSGGYGFIDYSAPRQFRFSIGLNL